MLKVDLNKPDEKIAQVIRDEFSQYGKVVSVKIHRLSKSKFADQSSQPPGDPQSKTANVRETIAIVVKY